MMLFQSLTFNVACSPYFQNVLTIVCNFNLRCKSLGPKNLLTNLLVEMKDNLEKS
jgi:hypothetical protein